MPVPDNDTICILSSFPSPYRWRPYHRVSPSSNMWGLKVVWPVRSPQHQWWNIKLLLYITSDQKQLLLPKSSASMFTQLERKLSATNILQYLHLHSFVKLIRLSEEQDIPSSTLLHQCNRQLYISNQPTLRLITEWHKFCWISKNIPTEGLLATNINNTQTCILNFPPLP